MDRFYLIFLKSILKSYQTIKFFLNGFFFQFYTLLKVNPNTLTTRVNLRMYLNVVCRPSKAYDCGGSNESCGRKKVTTGVGIRIKKEAGHHGGRTTFSKTLLI